MADNELGLEIVTRGDKPSELELRRIDRKLTALGKRLRKFPEPKVHLLIEGHVQQRRSNAEFRLQLGPLGPSLISHQAAETADRAVGAAIEDIERQVERHHANQRGEASFGCRAGGRSDRVRCPGRSQRSSTKRPGSLPRNWGRGSGVPVPFALLGEG